MAEKEEKTGILSWLPVIVAIGVSSGLILSFSTFDSLWNEPAGTTTRTVSEKEFSLRTPGNNPYLINYIVTPCNAPRPTTGGDAFDYNLLHNPSNRIFDTSAPQNASATVTAENSDQPSKTSAPRMARLADPIRR
jgi:hypothetical protein